MGYEQLCGWVEALEDANGAHEVEAVIASMRGEMRRMEERQFEIDMANAGSLDEALGFE